MASPLDIAASMTYGFSLSSSVFSSSSPTCGTQVSASLPYTTLPPISISVTLTAKVLPTVVDPRVGGWVV
ncbi:MAG: hypothetical protein M3Z96_03995 [Pseudomonadota bacterium]|nr:hypothetical protein [Pseudomonadota bacterium]